MILRGARARRLDINMTMADLVIKSNVSLKTISNCEEGRNINAGTARLIAGALGMKIKDFTGGGKPKTKKAI